MVSFTGRVYRCLLEAIPGLPPDWLARTRADRASTSSGDDQVLYFRQVPCGAALPGKGSPPRNLIHLYLRNELFGLTVMDSELRRTLLKAPSTSVSAALVRPLCSRLRTARLMPSFYSTSFTRLYSHRHSNPRNPYLPYGNCAMDGTGKQRAIVLDFLCHSSYTNTARAFSRECTVRNADVDADGDEVMNGDGRDELANGEDAGLVLSEDTLKQIELRKGEPHVLDTPNLCSYHALSDVCC